MLPDAAILESAGTAATTTTVGVADLYALERPHVIENPKLYPTGPAVQRALIVGVDLQTRRARFSPELAEFIALAKAPGRRSWARSCSDCRRRPGDPRRQRKRARSPACRGSCVPRDLLHSTICARAAHQLEKVIPLRIVEPHEDPRIFGRHAVCSREGQLQVEAAASCVTGSRT